MTRISDLQPKLVESILFRVPVTCMRRVRFTCKQWNTISKDPSFANKYFGKAARQFIMISDYRVWLMSVDLGDVDRYMKGIGKLTCLNNSDQVEILKVFHCNGLLLCLTKDQTRLVVWNPYLGQTKWIEPNKSFHRFDGYALGYDKNTKNHKILRFVDSYERSVKAQILKHEIFDLKSNSWKILDVTPDWEIQFYQSGVSLKGNTYFFAREKIVVDGMTKMADIGDFLICFDFTLERFGPHLPLPFHSVDDEDTVTLSTVREEQLAVLYQATSTRVMEIWVTNKIEPNAVSWNKLFLGVDMKPLTGPRYRFAFFPGSFFIDEERKMVVVFDQDKEEISHDRAYLVGNNGCYKEVDLGYLIGENGYHKQVDLIKPHTHIFPVVCSYFPTSVPIDPARSTRQKERMIS